MLGRLALAVAGSATIAGCYEMHGGTAPAPSLPDAPPPPRVDAPLVTDVSTPIDTSDLCASAIARLRAGEAAEDIGCDGRTFPAECQILVGACCTLFLSCAVAPGDGGHVVADMACTDLCVQSCESQAIEDCWLFPGCERFEPDACGAAPAGAIEGPACISERENRCESDADCREGRTCRSYWVHPCPGGRCAACGAEQRFCALPR